MNTPGPPADVLTILYDRIESYEQLAILLLLHRESPAWWSSNGIAAQLRIAPELTTEALKVLVARGLVNTDGDPPKWTYAPETQEIGDTIDRLANSYAIHRFEIVRLMSGNAIKRMRTQTLQAFADAFVLRKE